MTSSGIKPTTFRLVAFTLLKYSIYVFSTDLRTNSELWPIIHKLTGFYNRDGKCLLRGTRRVIKRKRIRFVHRGVICKAAIRTAAAPS
jgi:hypothetical protein